MKSLGFCITSLLFIFSILACGTVGKEFVSSRVNQIKQGYTKQSEILEMFGLPFKEGKQNGQTIWTYQHNYYSVINKSRYKDLVILFNRAGLVESYRYTTSSSPE